MLPQFFFTKVDGDCSHQKVFLTFKPVIIIMLHFTQAGTNGHSRVLPVFAIRQAENGVIDDIL